MKKRIFALALCVAMIASLIACTAPTADAPIENQPTTGGTQQTTDATAATDQAAASELDPIQLEFFLLKVQALGVHEEMAALFQQEHPHVTVQFVATPDAETAMFARIAAGDVPDMMNTFPSMLTYRLMMDDGLFVDLTDEPFMNRIPEDIKELSHHNGRQFSVPAAMSAYGVFYNRDIFAAHGLSVPETYEELLNVAQTLQDAGITPFAFYGRSAGTVGQLTERVIGILENDSDNFFRGVVEGRYDIRARPEVRIQAETILDIRNFSQPDVMAFDQDQAISEFATGRAAMIIGGTWFVTVMLEANPQFDFSIFPIPNPMGTFGLPISIDTAWSIYSGATCVDTAVAKLEFLTRTEIAQMYADAEGSPNVIQGVQFNTVQLANINDKINDPNLNVFLTPVNFWPPGMRARWQEYTQLLLLDGDIDGFITNTETVLFEFYD